MKPRHAAALVLVGWYLTVLGAGCLVIVVLTHVCERIHLFPVMGWGFTAPAIISTSARPFSVSFPFPQGISLRSRRGAKTSSDEGSVPYGFGVDCAAAAPRAAVVSVESMPFASEPTLLPSAR